MNRIAAGIVLYNPGIDRIIENVNAILPQVEMLILVDNGSSNIRQIESLLKNYKDIIWILNEQNLGIAAALNQIVDTCEREKFDWVLTLDQDSVCSSNLIPSFKQYISFDKVGIISPVIIDRNLKDEYQKENAGFKYIDRCITSGSLVNVSLCKRIGRFDEQMFIDLVDFEYCIRVKKAGYNILRINNCILNHQLGELKIYNFMGKKIHVTNHSEKRVYYYARNCIYYQGKHRDYITKRDVYVKLFIRMLKIIGFEKKKIKKLASLFGGIKSGVKMIP